MFYHIKIEGGAFFSFVKRDGSRADAIVGGKIKRDYIFLSCHRKRKGRRNLS
ncbi:MAG: hypothetical protein SOX21_02705 [Candidatus Enterosoma sp.]|nr:hypothetical protein [Candidatus Enterosoma sp.]